LINYLNNKVLQGAGELMKSKVRFLMAISIIGILTTVVLPGVNAEIFDLGTKVSESDLDLRGRKMVNFDSQTVVYTEPDYIDHIPLIFDGDESTGINDRFDSEIMWIELIFLSGLNVSTITLKPTFHGGATNYTLYINSNGIWSPWFAQKNNTQKTISINCEINGIWLELDNNGENHFYFNDVIINYTPDLVFENKIADLTTQIDDLTSELETLQLDFDNLKNDIDEDAKFNFVEFFIEPPFLGLMWILVLIALIMSMRRGRRNRLEKTEVVSESIEDQPPHDEPEETQPPEKEEEVGGRFCPSCGKFTEEKGAFCPHCKRSME
jgi:hypothetical protein